MIERRRRPDPRGSSLQTWIRFAHAVASAPLRRARRPLGPADVLERTLADRMVKLSCSEAPWPLDGRDPTFAIAKDGPPRLLEHRRPHHPAIQQVIRNARLRDSPRSPHAGRLPTRRPMPRKSSRHLFSSILGGDFAVTPSAEPRNRPTPSDLQSTPLFPGTYRPPAVPVHLTGLAGRRKAGHTAAFAVRRT